MNSIVPQVYMNPGAQVSYVKDASPEHVIPDPVPHDFIGDVFRKTTKEMAEQAARILSKGTKMQWQVLDDRGRLLVNCVYENTKDFALDHGDWVKILEKTRESSVNWHHLQFDGDGYMLRDPYAIAVLAEKERRGVSVTCFEDIFKPLVQPDAEMLKRAAERLSSCTGFKWDVEKEKVRCTGLFLDNGSGRVRPWKWSLWVDEKTPSLVEFLEKLTVATGIDIKAGYPEATTIDNAHIEIHQVDEFMSNSAPGFSTVYISNPFIIARLGRSEL